MVFYQQGAVLDKGLKPENVTSERRDTAVGAVLTQLIMISSCSPLPPRSAGRIWARPSTR